MSTLALQPAFTSFIEGLDSASAGTSDLPQVSPTINLFEIFTSDLANAITGSWSGMASYPTEVVDFVKSELAAEASVYDDDVGGRNSAGDSSVSLLLMGSAICLGVGMLLVL